MRSEITRVRAEVIARISKTSGNPSVFNVPAIAADLRRAFGDRVAVARLTAEDFWRLAGRRRSVEGGEPRG